jgi:hypothetical protein
MSETRRPQTRRTIAVVGLAVLLLTIARVAPSAWVPAVAAAAGWADFGTPTAKSAFTTGVTFSQPVRIDREVGRAELLLTVANAAGPTVIEVAPPTGTGAQTLTDLLDPSVDGHLLPNTPVVARWRLTSAADPTDIALGPEVRITYSDDRFKWKTQTGDLVSVHWYEGSDAFGTRALRIGEDGVRNASELLQVTETDPIDFYIYADQAAFYDALGPGTRENVGGEAIAEIRTMFALIPTDEIDDAWVGIVIPHELTHLVFNTAADNPYHFPPRWLNEGLAVYLSQGYDPSDRSAVEGAAGSGSLIPLDGLTGQFPTSFERFSLAYAESVSAVDYLIRAHGQDPLVSLIRSYAEGRTDDEAFEAALGEDATAFGTAWLEDVGASPPTRYGPKPAPPGPIPSAWLGDAGANGPPAASAVAGGTPGTAPKPTGGSGDSTVTILVIVMLIVVLIAGIGFVVRRRSIDPGTSG